MTSLGAERSYFEIQTNHLGLLKVVVGGPAVEITEHRNSGKSEESQIAVGKRVDTKLVLLLQTHDTTLTSLEAALKQAVETCIYPASKMPISGENAALTIWGITMITFVEV